MSDRYDRMTNEELVRAARIRGIPQGTIDLFRGASLARYLRDDDRDREDTARWEAPSE